VEMIVERPGALDVHKESVTACLRAPDSDGNRVEHLAAQAEHPFAKRESEDDRNDPCLPSRLCARCLRRRSRSKKPAPAARPTAA